MEHLIANNEDLEEEHIGGFDKELFSQLKNIEMMFDHHGNF